MSEEPYKYTEKERKLVAEEINKLRRRCWPFGGTKVENASTLWVKGNETIREKYGIDMVEWCHINVNYSTY